MSPTHPFFEVAEIAGTCEAIRVQINVLIDQRHIQDTSQIMTNMGPYSLIQMISSIKQTLKPSNLSGGSVSLLISSCNPEYNSRFSCVVYMS